MPRDQEKPKITLLVCDLDNTLYDWVTYFASSFGAMVDSAVDRLGLNRELLLSELQEVHRFHRNSEHPFALMEAKCVQSEIFSRYGRPVTVADLYPEFQAFNERRKSALKLYPSVKQTIGAIADEGARVVAHTEASAFNAISRLRSLGIADSFSTLYAIKPAEIPHPDPARRANPNPYDVRYLLEDERKPNPGVLRRIINLESSRPEHTLYVGDSISRDVGMAKAAGAYAAWAKYGTVYDARHWDTLVRVTHWNAEDVARAAKARTMFGDARADVVIDSFGELLNHFEFAKEP